MAEHQNGGEVAGTTYTSQKGLNNKLKNVTKYLLF